MKVLFILLILLNVVPGAAYAIDLQGPECTYQGNCNGHHGFANTNLPLIDLNDTHGDSITKRLICSIFC